LDFAILNVSEVITSLNQEFINQLYIHLRDQEKQTSDLAEYMLTKITDAAPEVRDKIAEGLSPALVAEKENLQQQLVEIEGRLNAAKGESADIIDGLKKEKSEVETQLGTAQQQFRHASLLLGQAAMRDVPWLEFIRRTMMPKQPGRVPFHHSAEVALRGYKPTGGRKTPVLREVTWAKLPERENNLHRGYKAGIVFKGSDFVPGITTTYRRRGENGPPAGNTDYFWRLPNIYFGDYLEISVGDDEIESSLSWRDYEFQVKNPEGEKSDWVLYTYPFDDEMLHKVRSESSALGKKLLTEGRAAEAIEPLRKAYVFSDRILGIQHPETLSAKLVWEEARDKAALAKLRHRVGDEVTVSSGPHSAKSGVIERLLLNHLHVYVIKPPEGEMFQASDEQIERAMPARR
jgi:hypothetical protein